MTKVETENPLPKIVAPEIITPPSTDSVWTIEDQDGHFTSQTQILPVIATTITQSLDEISRSTTTNTATSLLETRFDTDFKPTNAKKKSPRKGKRRGKQKMEPGKKGKRQKVIDNTNEYKNMGKGGKRVNIGTDFQKYLPVRRKRK